MAEVSPFPALRYDTPKAGSLENVLTQPYDKISPQMQQEYFRRSPYNLAHIVKGEIRDGDTPDNNVYTRAAAHFREWRGKGILTQDSQPAFYAYFQEFTLPGDPARKMVRKGFIGLLRLEEYDSGVVFRHEQTLSAPKADRLELLRATRAHFEQIFLLYSDAQRRVDALLDQEAARPPVARVTDDYGVIHTLWDIRDAERIASIRQFMQEQKLVIADGHHRYETALNFRRECRAARPHNGPCGCDYAPMAFVNMESEGIAILPTHRVVAGLPEFTGAGFLTRSARYFRGTEYAWSSPEQRAEMARRLRADMAAAAEAGACALGALFQDRQAFYLLTLREETALDRLLPELTPEQRRLEVTLLHRVAFALCLDVDEEAVREEKFLTYVREFEEAAGRVFGGQAQAAFFLNPARMQQIRDIAFAGRVLPQKSTDFYPKLLSGLAIYTLDG